MNSDVVISTRVRLARNLSDFPFPCKLNEKGKQMVVDKVETAIKESNSALSGEIQFLDLSKMNDAQRASLVEHHLLLLIFLHL